MDTGPEAIEAALKGIDLDTLEAEQKAILKKGSKTARPHAVRILNIIQGFRRNGADPSDLMLRSVPVIPTKFRPFSAAGGTFIPGDANEHYRDVMEYKRLYDQTEKNLGREATKEVYKDLADSVRAAYGFGDSPNPKTRSRGVKGFFEQVTGSTPKTGFVQSKLLAKPVDNAGRATIIPDADLGLDEILIPHDMAWGNYGEHVQARLVRGGMSPASAFVQVRDRSEKALHGLKQEMEDRPGILTRSPAWHKFNVTGVYPKLTEGSAIKVNTYLTAGHGADFDGDQMTFHTYNSPEAVKDIKDKLMVSQQLWSIKDMDKVVPVPKHEQILGLSSANWNGGKAHRFGDKESAMASIRNGTVKLGDDVNIG